MKLKTVQINWHGNPSESIFSIDFQYLKETETFSHGGNEEPMIRFATAGGDHQVRLWRLTNISKTPDVLSQRDLPLNFNSSNPDNFPKVQYLATLARHPSPVNVVRFSPDGRTLASGGDDGSIVLWRQKMLKTDIDEETGFRKLEGFNKSDEFALEFWSAVLIFRGSLSDIYDLNWSKCGKYILSGSVDNTSRVWDVSNGTCLSTQSDHTHYVQGVCWDPLEEFFISQSSDRSTKVYYYQSSKPIEQAKLVASHSRISITTTKKPSQNTNTDDKEKEELEDFQPNTNITTTKSINLYQSEALISFFRRPCFTPDGSLLLTAAGIGLKGSSDYCVHIYPRCSLLSSPPLRLSGFKSPVIAISCSPKLYPLVADKPSQFDLPYRMVIACATQNEVLIYDTQSSEPIASVKKIHYKTLTDLSWSQDGQYLIVTSSDGYCTLVQFDEHELEGTTEEVDVMSLEEARNRLRGGNTRIVGIEKFQQEMKKRPRSKADSMVSPIKSIPSAKLDAEASDSKPQESSTPKKRRIVPILVTEEPQTTSADNAVNDKTEGEEKTNKTEEPKKQENSTPKKRRIVPTLISENI